MRWPWRRKAGHRFGYFTKQGSRYVKCLLCGDIFPYVPGWSLPHGAPSWYREPCPGRDGGAVPCAKPAREVVPVRGKQ